MNELVLEIMKLALEINTEEKNTIFCYFLGHVLGFECKVYKNGWKEYIEPDYEERIYLDMEDANEKLSDLKKYLKDLRKEI